MVLDERTIAEKASREGVQLTGNKLYRRPCNVGLATRKTTGGSGR